MKTDYFSVYVVQTKQKESDAWMDEWEYIDELLPEAIEHVKECADDCGLHSSRLIKRSKTTEEHIVDWENYKKGSE